MNFKRSGLIAAILLMLFSPLWGVDEGSEFSSLVRGPVLLKGFPYIYPNALETWNGLYRYLNNDILVYLTYEPVLIPEDWKSVNCNSLDGYLQDPLLFFLSDEEWTLIIQFKETPEFSLPSDLTCNFIEKFVIRLKYLLRDREPGEPPLFPAILKF